MGALQAKAAAKPTGTFCGIAQAFWRGWHFCSRVSVAVPTAWGQPPSAPRALAQLNSATALGTADTRALSVKGDA